MDPNDLQAQVDRLYAHILASVDVSLDEDAEKARGAGGFKMPFALSGNTVRETRSLQTAPHATEHRSKVLSSGLCEGKSVAFAAAPCCAGGGDGVDNVPALTAPTPIPTEVRDDVEGCPCSCHYSSFYRDGSHTVKAGKEKFPAVLCSRHRSPTAGRPSVTGILPVPLRRQPPSTFGSGRKGMSETVKKSSTPGPGSYFCNDDNEVKERNSIGVHRSVNPRSGGSGGRQKTQKVDSVKEDAVEVLRRQFASICQCYWKEFPELGISRNPASHAANCPCQLICAALPKSNDSSRSTQSSCDEDAFREVNNRKHRTHAFPVVVSPRRGVCSGRKKMRGAVFGTSPRRTLFAEQHDEQRASKSGKQIPRQGAKGTEKTDSIPKSGRNSAFRSTTPSRQIILGEVDTVPGPGTYNVSSAFDVVAKKSKTRGVSIGRAERKLHTVTEAPGPGTYYNDDTVGAKDDQSKKKSYFLTSSPRRLQLSASGNEKTGPGPCEYDTENTMLMDARHKTAPAFSFGRAKLPKCAKALLCTSTVEKVDDVPGPGTYDVATVTHEAGALVSGRAAIMTTARRNDNMWRGMYVKPDDVPGPGTYTLPREERGPAYSLRVRPTEHTEPTPGPGQYMIPSESTGPQWTMTARRSSPNSKETSPGPGEYCLPIYDLRREHSTAPSFTTAPRLLHADADEAAKLPGPGNYDIVSMNAARTAVMGTAERVIMLGDESGEVPGPGAYMVQHTTQERRVTVPLLGTSSARFENENAGSLANPDLGPGSYDTDAQITLINKRGVILGTAPRRSSSIPQDIATDAGPGSYEIVVPRDGPFFSIRQRPPDNPVPQEATPGPGLYDMHQLSTGRSAVVGLAARFQPDENEKSSNEVPGPGAYTIVPATNSSPAVVFGTSPRMLDPDETRENFNNNNNLGPGNYDPQDIRGNISGAAWGLSLRFTEDGDSKAQIPGPGAYEVSSHSPVRNVVFGTAGATSTWTVPTSVAEQPGPGFYLPQDPKERRTPAVVFGSSPQHMLSPEERENFAKINLGPGAYDALIPTPHTFHATFGNTKAGRVEETPLDLTPGPGHYSPDIANVPPSRAVVFGTAPRNQLQSEGYDIPGPGAYIPVEASSGGGGGAQSGPTTFSTAARFGNTELGNNDGSKGDTPGPGAYYVERYMGGTTSGGAAVIGTGPRVLDCEQRERAQLPGPGQYKPLDNVTMARTSTYTFPTEPRMAMNGVGGYNSNIDVPGPGAYDVVIPTFTAPTTRFGTEERKLELATPAEVPGPGAYDVTTAVRVISSAVPSYHFPTVSRELPVNSEDTPGPGQYDGSLAEAFLRGDTKAPSFPIGPRFSEVKNDNLVPGPGQYTPSNPQWEASKAYSFSTGGREPLNTGDELPGPGTYDVVSKAPEGPVFSLHRTETRGLTLADMEKSQIPGPGAYSVPPVFPATEGVGAAVSFVRAERFQIPANAQGETPGPGFYSPQYLDQVTGCFIGRAPRLAEVGDGSGKANVPGPGHYEVYRHDPSFDAIVDGGVAMRFTASRFSRDGEGNAADVPGPASYNIPETLNVGNAISFPQAVRFVVSELNNAAIQPGPGEYCIPSSFNPQGGIIAHSFGTSARTDSATGAVDTPGPGSYDASRYTARFMAGPAFTLQGKSTYMNEKDTAEYPGPGAYCPRPLETARTTSFGTPTTVDQDAVFAAHVNSTPGPGAYVVPSMLSQQAVTFGTAERMTGVKDDLPGPGAYLTGGPVLLPSQPAFGFGSAPRPDITLSTQRDFPGPGEYHHPIDPKPSVPVFTFAGAERFKDVEEVGGIGPGQYYSVGSAKPYDGQVFSFPTASRAVTTATATATGSIGPGDYFHPYHWELSGRGPTFPVQNASPSINNNRH